MILSENKQLGLQYGLALFVFSYLYIGTGVHSDDYVHIINIPKWNIEQLLTLDYFTNKQYLQYIPALYFDFIQFYLFQENIVLYELSKIVTSFLCFVSIYKFSELFLDNQRAFLFSLLFVLYPIHDATTYWFIGQYAMINIAILMFAYRLLHDNKLIIGGGVSVIGAFWSYASPIIGFGLSIIWLMNKEYKKFIIYTAPLLLYVIYYFVISSVISPAVEGDFKTRGILDLINITKYYILQIGTFLDSSIGPSFWLKIYYSIIDITWVSSLFALLVSGFFYITIGDKQVIYEKKVTYAYLAVLMSAFLMFAITGHYPQIAFNLGNRVTIFGSLLIVLIIVMLPFNKKTMAVIYVMLFLSIFGISDHWKDWNKKQNIIINNIANNEDIKSFSGEDDILFVAGNQYSLLGELNHIEFFSESFVVSHVFKFSLKNYDFKISTLNDQFEYDNGKLLSRKYNAEIEIGENIHVYDSVEDKVINVRRNELAAFLEGLPKNKRHWVMLLGEDNIIIKGLLYFMPRLKYAFNN